jgi:uncharacterized protein (TIGR03118 family)
MKMYRGLAIAAALAVSAGSLAFAQNYTQVNLVANTAGVAPVTDPNLVDPWGISRGTGSPWWVADTGTGLSTLYNGAGAASSLVVTIPPSVAGKTGNPTGTIYNGSTTDFLLGPGFPASFLFDSIDGSISGWNSKFGLKKGQSPPNPDAVTVYKATDGSGYTGLTAATIGGKTYLYAANYFKGRVDVFNSSFKPVTLPPVSNGDTFNPGTEAPFFDALLPAGYSPFNVQAVGNVVVVAYALADFGNGAGTGYVDVYTSAGELLTRLQHGSWFNAPWGVALAPNDFGTYSHELLIGEFGGGTIDAFDLFTGVHRGQVLNAAGKPIVIEGLWALSAGNGASAESYDPPATGVQPAAEIYFTAGPNEGKDGLLGYLTPVSTELTAGNDQ